MFKKFSVIIFLFSFFFAKGVSAMELDFGFDFKAENIFLDLYINNVPAVTPGYDVGTSGSMQTNFDFKYMLYDGENNLTFITHKVEKANNAELKVLFKSWDVNNFTMPFEKADNGFILSFNLESPEQCKLENLGGKINVINKTCDIKETSEGYIISVDFDINYPDLYRSKYLDEAVQIKNTDKLKEILAVEYEKVYKMFKNKNSSAFEEYYSPSLVKRSKDQGGTTDYYFDVLFGKEFSDESFNVSELDLDSSRVYVSGDKKIFTLFPSPFRVTNTNTQESSSPLLYFWFDKNAQMQIMQ